MSSSLIIWTSQILQPLEIKTGEFIKSESERDSDFGFINTSEDSQEELIKKINEEFNKLVSLTSYDSTLHLQAIVACFDKESASQIRKICESCAKVQHKLSLHFFGLCAGLAHLFEKNEPAEFHKYQEDSVKVLKEFYRTNTFSTSFTLIDDYAANGGTIGFGIESLARYLSITLISLSKNYYSILSPSLLSAHGSDNISIGVSSLSFDKEDATDQLLGLGFLAALDNVGINETKVDSQHAAHEAEVFLQGIENRYPELYKKSIRPLYKEKGMSEGKAVAQAAEIIKENLASLRNDIMQLLKNKELTFHEKEAILAMISGRDNANLEGVQYEHEGTILDDACNDPINLYVKAYNDFCKDTGLLPTRGEFNALKIKIWNEEEKKYEDVPQNHEALNPLPDIKRLKQQILNTTSFLREKQEELSKLKKIVSLRENTEEIKKRWSKPEGNFIDIEYKEQPLDDKYEPDKALVIKESVDLRRFFSPVRNQKDLGACTSFAVASMYEAMMNRNGFEYDGWMSPGYLFYYTNILKGRPSGGSNYHDQLEVMGTHGICRDELYIYDNSNPSRKPSEEAEKDATQHRVMKALQIPLNRNSNRENAISHNHKLITSALSEGLPVGISLKVFDNLGKDGAFIAHPDEAGANEEGYHAMVIAGYSEENGFYIVRNSWGDDFGDEGYCYIPTNYIDDPEYTDFACVISQISDSTDKGNPEVPAILANFGATETEIRIAAIRNAIAKVNIELKNSQRLYADYYKYYQQLMLRLTMPKVQNNIRKAAEIGQLDYFANIEKRKRALEESFVAKLKDYKKTLQNIIFSFAGALVAFGIVWYYTSSLVMMILFIIAATGFILSWLGYKWWVRLKRRELQEQLDEIAVTAKQQKEILLEMQIKFHVAGMWLSNFHKLSLEVDNIYDRLVSFNDTLRAWQKNYNKGINPPEAGEGIMFRKLDPSPLLANFFEANKTFIVDNIDLISVFKDYQASVGDLDNSKERLEDAVRNSIKSLMEDFNMSNYLLGDSFPYLTDSNLQKEIDRLIHVGQPSYRNTTPDADTPVRMLLSNVENQRVAEWNKAVSPFFPLRPVILNIEDPNVLVLITLQPLS